jgi:hypothetical protein
MLSSAASAPAARWVRKAAPCLFMDGSVRSCEGSRMQTFVRALLLSFVLPGGLTAAAQEEARICYSAAETRTVISEHHLSDPLNLLRSAARQARAEPLASRLCKWGEDWVYEMTLLPRDGKVTRIYVNAVDGATVDRDR